jgi:hypothetical protein
MGPSHPLQTNEDGGDELETEWQLNEWHSVEDTGNNEASTSSDTVEQPDIVYIVRDIIYVRYHLFRCASKSLIHSPAYSDKN